MGTTTFAVTTARFLANSLSKRVKTTLPIVVETNDTDGNPVITLSADVDPATGEKVIVLRLKPVSWPTAINVLGGTPDIYGPHVIQICTEANYAGATDSVADILTPAELLPVLGDVITKGITVEWFVSANGTVPATTQMTDANLKATYSADLYNGMLVSQ